MRISAILLGTGAFLVSTVVGVREWGGRAQRPAPQPPPDEELAQAGEPPPPGAPAVVCSLEVTNQADREIAFLIDPEFHTIALFTYVRARTPILAPGDLQGFQVPPGPYQILVDGCPRGELVRVTPDQAFRLEFLAGPPGRPPMARLASTTALVFQTVLRPEPPPEVVYICPRHPDVRFLSPCDCPSCHAELIVIRPAVVYVCPTHTDVVVPAGGVCPECSTGLVVQMSFVFGSHHEEKVQVDPLGPAGGTTSERAGHVEHAEPVAPEEAAPPKEAPQPEPAKPGQSPAQPPEPANPDQPPTEPPDPAQPPQEPPEEPEQPPPLPEEPKEPPREEEPKKPPKEKPKDPPKEEEPEQPPPEEGEEPHAVEM